MRCLTEASDFYASAALALSQKSSDQTAGDRTLPMTVEGYERGDNGGDRLANGRYDFDGREGKLPKTRIAILDRLVFREQADYDTFVTKYGERFTCVVEPDVEAALRRNEDIFGNHARAAQLMEGAYSRDGNSENREK